MSVLSKASRFLKTIEYDDLPVEAIDIAKKAIIDYIGITLAGSDTPVTNAVKEYALWASSQAEARIVGTKHQVSRNLAALVNGTASHALDFDDVSWTTIGHPTVAVAPAIFSVGEVVNSSGRDIIQSYILGVEIMHKIAQLTMPEVSNNGWHTTSVYGPFGAAAAASLLMNLNENEITMALGLAASKASGVRANFGTMTKPYHAGMAAYNGTTAAILAHFGMASSDMAIEGQDGFIRTFSGKDMDEIEYKPGDPWDILNPGIVFKRYPCCSGTHPALDSILEILQETPFKEDEVESIDVGVSLLGPRELVSHDPQTLTEAKFSMEYALSAAIVFGKVGLDEYSKEENIQNEKIRKTIGKINMEVDPELAKLGFIGTAPAKITVKLKDGRILKGSCDLAKGNPEKPLSNEEISSKFHECAGRVLNKEKSEQVLDRLLSLEKINNVSDILDNLY